MMKKNRNGSRENRRRFVKDDEKKVSDETKLNSNIVFIIKHSGDMMKIALLNMYEFISRSLIIQEFINLRPNK